MNFAIIKKSQLVGRRILVRALWGLLIAVAVAWSNPVDGFFDFGDGQAGTAVLPFLELPQGARAIAMGAYDGPASNDAMAVFWNPATLPLSPSFQTQFAHTELLGMWRHEVASTVFEVPGYGFWGVGISGVLPMPAEGARDIEENPVELKEMHFDAGLSYGMPLIREQLYAGVRIKWLHSLLDDVHGDGYALDFAITGMMPGLLPGMRGSAVLQNLSHGFSYRSGTGTTEKLPSILRLGLGYADSMSSWAWQTGYSKSNSGMQRLHVGGEWNWEHQLFLRAGYEYDVHNSELNWLRGLGAGLAVRFSTLGLDYSIRSQGELGLLHTISFSIQPPLKHRDAVDYMEMARKAWKSGSCQDATKYAKKVLRENPSELDAVAILQGCAREAEVDQGNYAAFAFTANLEGQALSYWEGKRLVGGLSRLRTVLHRLSMQYPALRIMDAGHLQGQDSLPAHQERMRELASQLPLELANRVETIDSGKVIPWHTGYKSMKMQQRDVGVFAFSVGHVSVASIADSIEKERSRWNVRPTLQLLLLDASKTQARELIDRVGGIDLIVLSGKESLLLRPEMHRTTWILSPGRRGESVGQALAWFAPNKPPRWEFRMLAVDESIRPDSAFAEALGEEWQSFGSENQELVQREKYPAFLFSKKHSDGRRDIWKFDETLGRGMRLTKTPIKLIDADMAWSRQVFYAIVDSGNGRMGLGLQKATEKGMLDITDSGYSILSAQWEPYENWLYSLQTLEGSSTELFRRTWSGTHSMNLSRGQYGSIQSFHISPNGRSLAFASLKEGKTQVWNYALNLAHGEPISPDSFFVKSPQFNPSGKWITYLARTPSDPDTLWSMFLWDSRSDETRKVIQSRPIQRYRWSLDGRRIYLEVGINRSSILLLDPVTGKETPLKVSLEEVSDDSYVQPMRWKGKEGFLYRSTVDQGPRGLRWSDAYALDEPAWPLGTDSTFDLISAP